MRLCSQMQQGPVSQLLMLCGVQLELPGKYMCGVLGRVRDGLSCANRNKGWMRCVRRVSRHTAGHRAVEAPQEPKAELSSEQPAPDCSL